MNLSEKKKKKRQEYTTTTTKIKQFVFNLRKVIKFMLYKKLKDLDKRDISNFSFTISKLNRR